MNSKLNKNKNHYQFEVNNEVVLTFKENEKYNMLSELKFLKYFSLEDKMDLLQEVLNQSKLILSPKIMTEFNLEQLWAIGFLTEKFNVKYLQCRDNFFISLDLPITRKKDFTEDSTATLVLLLSHPDPELSSIDLLVKNNKGRFDRSLLLPSSMGKPKQIKYFLDNYDFTPREYLNVIREAASRDEVLFKMVVTRCIFSEELRMGLRGLQDSMVKNKSFQSLINLKLSYMQH